MLVNNKRTITATLAGGLGNQLFIYAACRRFSIKNKFKLILDKNSGFKNDFLYSRTYELDKFNLPYDFNSYYDDQLLFSNNNRKYRKITNKFLPLNYKNYLYQEGIDFDNRILNIKPKASIRIEGYWQSENYFKDIEETIRSDLKFEPLLDQQNLNILNQIKNSCSIAVHIREPNRTLLGSIENDLSNYYAQSIRYLVNQVNKPKLFIFSDNISNKYLIDNLNNIDYSYISNNDPIIDFYLMSSCKNFIIADSTFSWWAAWLSNNLNKIIIAPSYINYKTERAWGFKGLIPDDWIVF